MFETCAYLSPALQSSSLMWKVFSPLVELLEIHQPPVLLLSTVLFQGPRSHHTGFGLLGRLVVGGRGTFDQSAGVSDELQRLECEQ